MIVIDDMKGKEIAVFGLARSGLAAVHALTASGAKVVAGDDDKDRLDAVGAAAADLSEIEFSGLAGLVLSPGVPLSHTIARKARDAGVPVIGDMELFAQARTSLPAHRLAAVTGTNGKSTTAALLHHVLTACGAETVLAGNIGAPILEFDPLPEGGVYVFEMSSFQLDLTKTLKADVAILLNIAPDHLDRHGGMAEYIAAKRRLFDFQSGDQVAIIGVDDDDSRSIASTLPQRVVPISAETAVPGGAYVLDGTLFDDIDSETLEVGDLSQVETLRGRHNWQNAAAAFAAARLLGVDADQAFGAIQSFPGLPHRMEFVGRIGGITFINDSKATNTASATAALSALVGDIYWIVGGQLKEASLDALDPVVGGVKKAYLIGEATETLASYLGGRVASAKCGTLEAALDAAIAEARAENSDAIILLSPAAASFDQFNNFEDRGDAFRQLVTSRLAQVSVGGSGS